MVPSAKGDGSGVGGGGDWVLAVDRGVLHKAAHIVKGEEAVVDGHGHHINVVLEGGVADAAVDVAKTVYFNLDSRAWLRL